MYDDEPELGYPSRNRGPGNPYALGSTATTTTQRSYDINEISSQGKILYGLSETENDGKKRLFAN